jgi:sialate O-acetylesterase
MNKLTIHSFPILIVACALASSARAVVTPTSLFSDNAVLQQNAEIPVWGTAKDGEKVTVQFDGQSATTIAKDGKWMLRLNLHKAGGPFTMTIAGENTITIKNVLVGEVWVCSGQSNMNTGLDKTANAATDIAAANYPKIRLFVVEKKTALQQ